MHAVYGSQNQINREGKIKVKKKPVAYIMMKLTKKTLSTPVYSSLQLVQLEQFVQVAGDAPVGPAQHAGRRARTRRARGTAGRAGPDSGVGGRRWTPLTSARRPA